MRCSRCAATFARCRGACRRKPGLAGAAARLRRVDGGPPKRRRGSVELLLTLDEGRAADARSWDSEDIELDPRRAARRHGSSPRPAASRPACGARRREALHPREIVVLLRAFTHVDAYEEALRRTGLRPFVVGGAATGPAQVEDLIRLLGVVANPLDDGTCSVRSPRSRSAPAPMPLASAARRRDEEVGRATCGRFLSGRFGSSEPPASSRLNGSRDAGRRS